MLAKTAYFTCFIMLILLVSCKKKCKETDIKYVGINNNSHVEISSILIKRYSADKNLDNVLDSTVIEIPLTHSSTISGNYRFTSGHDYSIALLPVGRTYKVTEIHFGTEKTSRSEEDNCYTSYYYKIDGKQETYGPVYYGYIFVTI